MMIIDPKDIVDLVINKTAREILSDLAEKGLEVLFYNAFVNVYDTPRKIEHRLVVRLVKENKVWLFRITDNIDENKFEFEIWEGKFEPLVTDLLCQDYTQEVEELIRRFEGELIGEEK